MTKQDEKLRLRRRLQDQAIDMAAKNRWEEAAEANRQIINLGEDADAYNRLGKAYFELGRLVEARDAYQRAIRLNPTNAIARKNLERIEELIERFDGANVPLKRTRQLVDLRLFITETGKTCLTLLVDVPPTPAVKAIVTGEKIDLRLDGRNVLVIDTLGNVIGRLEPKLAQRLSELMAGGNRYAAAVAQINSHQQLRILIREVYQDPSQRGRVSFPGKLGEAAVRGYVATTRYDEYGEDLIEEETIDEREDVEEEPFGGDEEELGLDEIEQDINEEEDLGEE